MIIMMMMMMMMMMMTMIMMMMILCAGSEEESDIFETEELSQCWTLIHLIIRRMRRIIFTNMFDLPSTIFINRQVKTCFISRVAGSMI